MSDTAAGKLWKRIRSTVDADAGHLHRLFFPQDAAVTMTPNDSYLRLWLSELHLARERAWGADRIPAVQASIRLLFGGPRQQTFTTLVQPTVTTGHGVFEDYQLTELLPYRGQSVEVQAGLYEILGKNNLLTAIEIVTEFASLVTPPLSAVLPVVDKVASGIEKVIEANASDPALALHGTLAAPGAGTGAPNELKPGWLAVVRATEDELPASQLHLSDHRRLCRAGKRLTGFDYLVLWIEGRSNRDDWRTPDLDQAIATAVYARDLGRSQEYERLREDALSKIYFSADLTPPQRRQVAKAVKEELDSTVPGATTAGEMTVKAIINRHGLPSRQQVANLTLAGLLGP